jgi:hypothetical protein
VRIEQVRNLIEAQPFQPFSVRLPDGRGIPVRHREFIMPSPSGRTVIVHRPDDSFSVIDLMLVADLEVQPDGSSESPES